MNALTANGLSNGGPDDNTAQAGHLIPILEVNARQGHGVFVKAGRAQTNEDDETWTDNPVAPTLNVFDNNTESRATVLTVVGDKTHALTGEGHDASEDGTGRGTPIIAFTSKDYGADAGEVAPTLRSMSHDTSHMNGGGKVAVASDETQVRRLTPLECERLQGFPDDWTGGQADSPRYKQMGNAVAVPVVEWIMHRIVAVDAVDEMEAAA